MRSPGWRLRRCSAITGITATDHRNNPDDLTGGGVVRRVLARTFCSARISQRWRGSADLHPRLPGSVSRQRAEVGLCRDTERGTAPLRGSTECPFCTAFARPNFRTHSIPRRRERRGFVTRRRVMGRQCHRRPFPRLPLTVDVILTSGPGLQGRRGQRSSTDVHRGRGWCV